MARRACLMLMVLLVVPASEAAPPKPSPDANQDGPRKASESDADKEHRLAAERVVGGIEIEVKTGDTWAKVKRIEKPLLAFGDPTRAHDRGTVWGWGEKGRPVAVMELYQDAVDRTKWVHVVCNTSGKKLRATRGGTSWWQENESAADLKDVPGAPAPAAEDATRQRQIKQLAQQFTGHEFWDPNKSRFELRRLDRPLHTYRDEDAGIREGALYTLANGTNPELLLFVEARANPKDSTKAVWQFAVGRLAHAELHLLYDGKEVFEAGRGTRLSGRDQPYWLGYISTAKP